MPNGKEDLIDRVVRELEGTGKVTVERTQDGGAVARPNYQRHRESDDERDLRELEEETYRTEVSYGWRTVEFTSDDVHNLTKMLAEDRSMVSYRDWTSEIEGMAEEFANQLIYKFGVSALGSAVGNDMTYHEVVVAVNNAIKRIGVAVNDVRQSWAEDSADRITAHRKRRAALKGGQREMPLP